MPHLKVKGTGMWFVSHQATMMTGVIIALIAFVIIFVGIDGWSESAGAHAIVGVITVSLMLLNPIMATFRPSPGNDHLSIFRDQKSWFIKEFEKNAINGDSFLK